MPQVVQITSENFEGQSALVTFYPCTGGTITIGYVTIPYNYEADYYYGTYTLYFPLPINETCEFSIPCPTPTPTPTKTTTPTKTNPKTSPKPTSTKTPTPTPTSVCFCYNFINDTTKDGKLQYYDCNNRFIQTIVDNSTSESFCISPNAFTASSYVNSVLIGPCVDGRCPQIKPTQTPTVTRTPRSTQKPTSTPTVTRTQNSTPKPTRTPTSTPTPTKFPQINQCDVLYVTMSGQVYSFDPVTNTSLNLTSFFQDVSLNGFSLDIAHTQDTLWLLGETQIQEWYIQLSPFSAEFSRYITLPATNIGDGLAVIDDNTLIASRYSDIPGFANQILKLDITTDTAIPELLFFLPVGRFVTGDISYNSSNKLLITNQDGEGNTFVNQYNYLTGDPEVEINITSTVSSPAGLYSFDNNIFVVNYNSIGQSYKMDLSYPYTITFETNINPRIKGTSQLTDCFKQSFRPTPLLPTPSGTATPTPTPTSCLTTIVTIEATPPTSEQVVGLLQNIGNSANSNQGALFHDPYNLNGTSPGNVYYAISQTSVVWKRTNSSNGPLNRSGLWAANPDIFPVNTWLGFSLCIEVPSTKTYWIGLGGDNNFRIAIDGTDIVNTVGGPYDGDFDNGTNFAFIWWHVYPVTLDAGNHIIDLYGLNRDMYSTGPSAASFGCEIYDNTIEELLSAAAVSDLNIIFSSSGQTSATTVQSLTEEYLLSGYSCPVGYTFNPCDLTCFIEIDACIPSPSPSPTPTLTKTPTPTPTRCCFNFDMYGGTQTGGSNFEITYCNNTTTQIQVNQFTMYSTQYGSSLCAFDVIRLSGNGIVYTGSCGCINPTSTPTMTPTPTPTKQPVLLDCGLEGSGFTTNTEVVTSCEILLRGQTRIYKYDTNSPNTSTELVIPNLTFTLADITHTQTKLFAQFESTPGSGINSIRVWDLNLSPFGASFSQDISLGFTIGYGIFALNNTTLIVSTGETTSCFIEIDITDPIYIGITEKFCLSSNRKVSNFSNFILTDNNKLIVSNTHDDGFSTITYHLTQFDYSSGFEEQDVLVASEGNNNISNFIIIENETQILIGKEDIYNIPINSPYIPLTLFGNPNFTTNFTIYGASQKYNVECLPVDLIPVSVNFCDVLIRSEGRIYKYDFDYPNESIELVVPNLSLSAADLTFTEGKLFTQYKQGGIVGAYYNYLRVWDITLSPFVATYSQDINLGFFIGPGILAIDDFTIIAATGETTSCFIQMNISDPNNISVTPLFCLANNRKVSVGSNFILNDNSKLIISNYLSGVTSTFYITQYDFNTYDLEVDIEVPTSVSSDYGFVIVESPTQILAGNSSFYEIPTESPYSPVTLFGNPNVAGMTMYGAAQGLYAGCLNLNFGPQIIPTPTPTNTPTITNTPTNTVTITKSPTNTPTVTNTPSITTTMTVTPSITPVNECFVLYNTGGLSVYRYNPSNNISTLLPVSGQTDVANDIAHTATKLWLGYTTNDPADIAIKEWNITLNPWSATFSQDIYLYYGANSAGLFAVNNNLLILVRRGAPQSVYELDPSLPVNNPTNPVFKFFLPSGYSVAGDYLLTTTNKLLLTMYGPSNGRYFAQINYATGVLDFPPVQVGNQTTGLTTPFGIYEWESNIYIINNDGAISGISTTYPYTLTPAQNIGINVNGASQLYNCVDINLTPVPNTITIAGSFNLTNNPYDISSENLTYRYYSYSQDGTEILDSEYKSVDTLSFSAYSGNTLSKVLFDPTNFKMYFGSFGNEFIDVYNIVGLSTSQIDLSSYSSSPWNISIDPNNNILGVVNGNQYGLGNTIFIDTTTDSILGYVSGLTAGYRGGIASDSLSLMGSVSTLEDYILTYDIFTQTTASTISISASTGGYRSIIYNQTNGYYYVLNFGEYLEWVDPNVGSIDSVSLSGYSGSNVNSAMVYNPLNDRIYILNVKSNGDYGIITVDCSTNTIINFTDKLLTGGGTGVYEGGLYLDTISSPYELLLWTKTNKTVYRLSIP